MRGLLDVRAIVRFARVCRRFKPDIVHTQLSRADWIGRSVAAAEHLPVVSTIQNVHSRMYAAEFSPAMAWLGRYLDSFTFPFADRLIAVSRGVKADLQLAGVDPARVTVIPNTFDASRTAVASTRAAIRDAWGVRADDVVVGNVALLKAQKGLRHLVEAARLVALRMPHVRFIQMGDGPLQADVARWIAAAGLGDRFQRLGRVDDPMALLPGLDVFVLPSEWEGQPIALLEAMAAGLPAVGTRVSGVEDTIVDGETGRLVPFGDAGALADALSDLCASPDIRRAFGEAGRRRVNDFDAVRVAAAYRRVYLDVLEQARPS